MSSNDSVESSEHARQWQDVRTALNSIESDLQMPSSESETTPYSLLAASRLTSNSMDAVGRATGQDIDEWILRNERWLRSPNGLHWSFGLVKMQDLPTIFYNTSEDSSAITITRPNSMIGFNFLDLKRASQIRLQSSLPDFVMSFHHITQGVLKGLDWQNVFIAGGIVLGTLLSPPSLSTSQTTSEFTKSDIDLYIHGLGPAAACEKIREVYEIVRSNLPLDASILVVRNSKTITFFSKYPIRRIQIVLKLVENPRDVLLNFDLDICAIGFDGVEVYMLPRAARALERDRRASQQDRVFKYANRGYGIRIIPSYVNAVGNYESAGVLTTESSPFGLPDLDTISRSSRQWVSRLIDRYVKWGHTTTPTIVPSSISPQIRASWLQEARPVFTHAMLESRNQSNPDSFNPRSCLSSFALLMRHVALWERSVKGHIRLQEDIWASQVYSDLTVDGYSYYDTPKYPWDENFTLEGFAAHIDTYNTALSNAMLQDTARGEIPTSQAAFDLLAKMGVRMTYASDVSQILDPAHDIVVPIFLSEGCVRLINQTIREALFKAGVRHPKMPLRVINSVNVKEKNRRDNTNAMAEARVAQAIVPVVWTLDNIFMWQKVDRRMDEIFELLWANYRSLQRSFMNCDIGVSFQERLLGIIEQPGTSKARPNELDAFVKWVNTCPLPERGTYGAMGHGWSHDTDSDREGSDDEFGSLANWEEDDE
ncbi:hypothetical protein SISNIDRAFT_483937 [Sistotremastrum niveocremeum HHB9708]|uniref:Uncharacterized protein n=1 Tax=Sistotremastrum niveocremeum HHB9708 TaxID=1314777 RepID=A0A164WGQ7_9AGAM|nr:hypothetical protein SISNIDRAFT_483937 [Sistotremastrum niveocremeum HHB9708]